MSVIRLSTFPVQKPWGRTRLGSGFEDVAKDAAAIGEIWFADPPGMSLPLLVKYLFTSERLSIQVHPDDAAAQALGHPCGKEECWVILEAAPEARLGLGLTHSITSEALRAAALDGSLEDLIDWRPVKTGDVVYLPAGTIHAIGAGLTLVEVQQNIDLTYRLYDYGRPRPLHLDEAVAVAHPTVFSAPSAPAPLGCGRMILTTGRKFTLERWTWDGQRSLGLPAGLDGWLVPLAGTGTIDGAHWAAGQCWLVRGHNKITANADADLLFAYPAPAPYPLFA